MENKKRRSSTNQTNKTATLIRTTTNVPRILVTLIRTTTNVPRILVTLIHTTTNERNEVAAVVRINFAISTEKSTAFL